MKKIMKWIGIVLGGLIGSAMPLKTYGEMNDTELVAVWLYLQSLSPVKAQN